jgi:iron complex outermembrane recepter protein
MRTALFFALSLALASAAGASGAESPGANAAALGAEARSAKAAQSAVSGIVRDNSGAVVSGASVIVIGTSGPQQQTVSAPDGRFTIAMAPAGDLTVIVRAGGFAEWSQSVPASREVEVVLAVAGLFETVTVTPTRTAKRLGDVPVSANIIEKETIRQSPAVVVDDVLRQVSTFSLFRRSSSLSSHPTAQGVSLRGIGPSGVSRTLVLVDGMPFNDPFGGWVYWTRVPMESVNRIEVIDGSSSSLYGNYGMGGVINIISTTPARRSVEFKTQYGNRNSPKADFFASDVWGKLGVAVEGGAFNTEGFPIVTAAERGIIDNNAEVDFRNLNVRADYRANDRLSVFFRGGYFKEDRVNGKIDEVNDTKWTAVGGGVRAQLPDGSDLQATVFTDDNTFHSTFLAVNPAPYNTRPPRSIVRLATDQAVPTDAVGTMVQWSRNVGRSNYFSAGLDWRGVDGDSLEDTYVNGAIVAEGPTAPATLTARRDSGGTQRSVGLFLQDVFTMNNLVLTLAARVDSWKNYDGHIVETSVATGLPTAGNRGPLPDKDDTVVSPRGALLYRISDRVSVWGDVGWGFRAPTLNELYRQFSVGLVRTLANEDLGPERLFGGEAGVRLEAARNVSVRSTWYDNTVKDPVSNVTRTDLVNTQQRQNLGRTRIRGWQNDVEMRMGSSIRVAAGYLFNDAKVTENPANPALVGLYLPQVPKHRGSVSFSYSSPRYATFAVTGMFYGRQYDDDLNVRTKPGESEPGLPPYGTLDLSVSRDIGRHLDVFFGVQNLFDQEYYVMLQPTTTGSPRLVNGGIRVRFNGR